MADYSRYKTETLKSMASKAFDKYYSETTRSIGNWGDGMRLSKLPSITKYEIAKERYEAICKELKKRGVNPTHITR